MEPFEVSVDSTRRLLGMPMRDFGNRTQAEAWLFGSEGDAGRAA